MNRKRIIVFSKPLCSACDQLKAYLELKNIEYESVNGETSQGRTFMLTHNIFLAYYPAFCVDGRLYEYSSIFDEHGQLLDLREMLAAGIKGGA